VPVRRREYRTWITLLPKQTCVGRESSLISKLFFAVVDVDFVFLFMYPLYTPGFCSGKRNLTCVACVTVGLGRGGYVVHMTTLLATTVLLAKRMLAGLPVFAAVCKYDARPNILSAGVWQYVSTVWSSCLVFSSRCV
jgi:hypothetical protein